MTDTKPMTGQPALLTAEMAFVALQRVRRSVRANSPICAALEAIASGEVVCLPAPRAEQAEGWRPIESAPRDGTKVLAAWAGTDHAEVCECGDEGRWFYSYDGDSPTERQGEPTHWQPYAPPPSAAPALKPDDV